MSFDRVLMSFARQGHVSYITLIWFDVLFCAIVKN